MVQSLIASLLLLSHVAGTPTGSEFLQPNYDDGHRLLQGKLVPAWNPKLEYTKGDIVEVDSNEYKCRKTCSAGDNPKDNSAVETGKWIRLEADCEDYVKVWAYTGDLTYSLKNRDRKWYHGGSDFAHTFKFDFLNPYLSDEQRDAYRVVHQNGFIRLDTSSKTHLISAEKLKGFIKGRKCNCGKKRFDLVDYFDSGVEAGTIKISGMATTGAFHQSLELDFNIGACDQVLSNEELRSGNNGVDGSEPEKPYELLEENKDCDSGSEHRIGSDTILDDCAGLCRATDGCEYFTHGTNWGCWYEENMSGDSCGGKLKEANDYDFYKIPKPSYELLKEKVDCDSGIEHRIGFDTFLDECAGLCRATEGCEYFTYGRDDSTSDKGGCWHEVNMSGDSCGEKFKVANGYNFYKITNKWQVVDNPAVQGSGRQPSSPRKCQG